MGGGIGGGGGGGGEYQRRVARSRNGGMIGGVWASGGRRKRGTGGVTGQGRLGGAPPPSPSRGSGLSAWGGNGTVGQWGSAGGGGGGGGGGGLGGGGGSGRFSKPHEFLRRSRPDATTATYSRSTVATHSGSVTRFPPPDGRAVAGRGGTAHATTTGVDEFWPRTQILGMNGGRLPRQVRQAPADRPLTAPCGKVGRRRVRTRGGSRGAAARP